MVLEANPGQGFNGGASTLNLPSAVTSPGGGGGGIKHLVLVEKVVLVAEVAAEVLLLYLVTELVQVEELQIQYLHQLDGVIMVDKITEMNHIVQAAAVALAQMVMMVEMPIISQRPCLH